MLTINTLPKNVFIKLKNSFYSKSKIGIAEDDCWSWTAFKDKDGYGKLQANISYGNSKCFRAHRVSYELHVGLIPEGLLVLHRCDNPECSNPRHLFLGTSNDNRRDMLNKDRQGVIPSGECHHITTLTEEDVLNIYLKKLTGIAANLAKDFNVSEKTITNIWTGYTWSKVTRPPIHQYKSSVT